MDFFGLIKEAQFHGARRFSENRCRLAWGIALSILFGCSVTVVWVTIKRFMDNPTYIVQMESYQDSMPFPSVWVCPEISFQEHRMEQFVQKLKYPEHLNASYLKTILRQLAAFYSPDVIYNVKELQRIEFLLDYNNMDIDTAGRELMTSCEETLLRCRWSPVGVLNCSTLFEMELTGDGYCCIFNGRSLKKEIQKSGIHGEVANKVYFTDSYGFLSGLMLVVNQTQKLDNVDLSYKWIALQGSQHYVESTVNGTPLNPGSEQWVSYFARGFQIADDAKSLSVRLRNCRLTNEALKYFPIYKRNYCILECEMERTLETCHCVRAVHPRLPGIPYCRSHSLYCAQQAMVAFDNNDCDCPQACDVPSELISMSSFHMMPNVKPLDKFYEDLDFAKVTVVRVFIQSREITVNTRWSFFGSTDLFAQLGGVFNVFFGVSILSILELIQLLWYCIKYFRTKYTISITKTEQKQTVKKRRLRRKTKTQFTSHA